MTKGLLGAGGCTRALIALAALFSGSSGCNRDLSVPPARTVSISSFDPPHGYAGARVTIHGRDLGVTVSEAQVRFGTSAATAPLSADPSGTQLVVKVPDDAVTGSITVTAPAGRATSADSFTYDGLGHVRLGAVTAQADLRPILSEAVLLSGTLYAVFDPEYQWAAEVDTSNVLTLLSAHHASALAPAGQGAYAVVDTDPTGCADAGARITLSSTPGTTCLPAGSATVNPAELMAAAVDDGITHAAIAATNLLWVVDLTASPPTARSLSLSQRGVQLAWAGGTRFLYLDGAGLHGLDWTQDPLVLEDLAVSASSGSIALAAAPGKLAVAANDDGSAYLYDLSAWPPVDAGSLRVYDGGPSGVAISPDGTRLAIAETTVGSLTTFAITPPQVTPGPFEAAPLVSIAVDQPGAVTLGPDSFVVAQRGGVLTVSQQTGQRVGFSAFSAHLRTPRYRVVASPIAGQDTLAVVEVALSNLNALARLDAGTLVQASYAIDLDPPDIQALASGPEFLYTLHDLEVRKVVEGSPGLAVESAERWSPSDAAFLGTGNLTASPDGAAVLLEYNAGSFFSAAWKVAVLDPKATWDTNYKPPSYSLDTGTITNGSAWVDGHGHLGIIGGTDLRTLDLTDALAGKETVLARTPNPLTFVEGGSIAGGTLFAVGPREVSFDTYLADLPLAQPAHDAVFFPEWTFEDNRALRVAVGGQRLWSIKGTGGQRRLVSVELDPDDLVIGREEAPIPLPPGADNLFPFPDGSAIVVVDTAQDQLLLVQ